MPDDNRFARREASLGEDDFRNDAREPAEPIHPYRSQVAELTADGSHETTAWHTLAVDAVLTRLGSRSSGLTAAEAAERKAQYGPNELQEFARTSAWHIFLTQFKNVLVLILLAATLISGVLGHTLEAVVITVIVMFAVMLGFIQEYRAGRALEALQRMAAPVAHVLRDGTETSVAARDLVPGDVVTLRAGDRVPADVRILLAVSLAIDEAALTGESVPVEKTVAVLADPHLAMGDRTNLGYAGTLVAHGRGQAVVVATGMSTEFGRISRLVQSVEAGRTPLQENLDRLGATLGKAALLLVSLVVAVGLWRGLPPLDMFLFGIALAVAVVPEALPAVVTISLAIGVRRMVRRNALVRRLPIVEALGSTSVICSDKTGTLTRNEMTVRHVFVDGRVIDVSGVGYEPAGEFRTIDGSVSPSATLLELLRSAVLSSDARLVHIDGQSSVEGDPTEGALLVAAAKAGLAKDALERDAPRIHEIPFTSERRRMTTVHSTARGTVAYSKGATDVVVAECVAQAVEGQDVPLTRADRQRLHDVEFAFAREGLRVLALARKQEATETSAEQAMTLLGLVAMMDPPRPEARAAIATCRAAGIMPVMVTGDHPMTARTIAMELGMLGQRRVVSGHELDTMSDETLAKSVSDIGVYARVSPSHKLRVIDAWQGRGEVVAMTGDGVNDAPALKKADVGVAMGVTGTDVSKEAAGITLLDDNFATIVAAVEEGRIVFGNIKKYLMYLLSSNIGEIVLMAGAVLAGLPLPLTAVQILYVNLATDGLPALALAVDPPEPDLMRRQPRNPRAGIFTRPVVTLMLAGGLWSGLVTLGLFTGLLGAGRPLEEAMALTFVLLVLIQFFNAYNCRSDRLSVLQRPLANRWLNLAVVWELLLLLVIVYVPFLHEPLGTFALAPADWALAVGLALTVIPVLEIAKWMQRRGWLGRPRRPYTSESASHP